MSQHKPRPWWRRATGRAPAAMSALALAVAVLPVTATPAQAVTQSTPIRGAQGFPQWYEDAQGNRLELCLDNLSCSAVSDTLSPAFGTEAVYWAAEAAPPEGLGGNGLILAVEAGFDPTTGAPITATVIRIRLRGLVPGGTYTVTTPYGTFGNLEATSGQALPDEDGRIERVVEEFGCIPVEPPETPPVPEPPHEEIPPGPLALDDAVAAAETCDFNAALQSSLFDGFLRQEGAPQGFLGEGLLALTPKPVTGRPKNYFQVEGPNLPAGGLRQDLFLVEGRVAAPLKTSAHAREFGEQKVGTVSPVQGVRVQNVSGEPVVLGEPKIDGSNPGAFTVAPSATAGCDGLLDNDQACRVDVTFHPGSPGFMSAVVSFPTDLDERDENLVRAVTVSGNGAVPQATIRSALNFGDVGVGKTMTLPVTVTNPGNVDLDVSSATRSGSAEFTVNAAACTTAPLPARRSCDVDVTYRPSGLGADTATLAITHDAAGGPRTVNLSARGVDVTAPVVQRLRVRPARFNPLVRSATVSFGLNGRGLATVRIMKGRQTVRSLETVRFRRAGSAHTAWNGRNQRGALVAAGTYKVTVTARDQAGNTSAKSARVVVTR